MKSKRSSPIRIPSAKSGDQPATRKMLNLVRTELKSEIKSLRIEMTGLKGELRSEMMGLKGEMTGLKTELRGEMNSFREEVRGSLTRIELLVEEQNANNRIALEGLQALWQRQTTHEKDKAAHSA